MGMRGPSMLAIAVAVLAVATGSAYAEYRFCNRSEYSLSAAIGYRDGGDWVSRGWWHLLPGECQTLVDGPLQGRYYYTYAYSREPTAEGQEGLWSGEFYMCTGGPDRFAIRGVESCQARGYERHGFQEVDTSDRLSWTTQFVSPAHWPNEDSARIAGAQRMLNRLGYTAGRVDGEGGSRTRSAVEAFQRRAGVPADGEITPELVRMLSQAAPDRAFARDPVPTSPELSSPAPAAPAAIPSAPRTAAPPAAAEPDAWMPPRTVDDLTPSLTRRR